MRRIFIGSLLLFICTLLAISIPKIQKYNYLTSGHFISDITKLEICIYGYLNTRKKFPSSFEEFLPPGEELYPEDYPEDKKPTKKFYKLNLGFCKRDSMLIIYLYDFNKRDKHLSVSKHFKDIKLSDVFVFKGDIVVDTLYERSNIYEPSSPPPLPSGKRNPED